MSDKELALTIAAEMGLTEDRLKQLQEGSYAVAKATLANIKADAKKAFGKLACRHHPDHGGSKEAFQLLIQIQARIKDLQVVPRPVPSPVRQQRAVWTNSRAVQGDAPITPQVIARSGGYFEWARRDQRQPPAEYNACKVVFFQVV